MPRNNMPANWEAPYPSWSADFADISAPCLILYGVQSGTADFTTFRALFHEAAKRPGGPVHCEYGRFTDTEGLANFVIMAYWRSSTDHERWRVSSGWQDWLDNPARLQGEDGYWIEGLTFPLERFETLFSSETPAGAAALTSEPMTGPIEEHGYWGGMRDRIPLSETDAFKTDAAPNQNDGTGDTRGKRIRLTAPKNLCMIHSAQDWRACEGAEKETYLGDVHPVLKTGMAFLATHGAETNCITCRFIEETDADGNPLPKSCGFAYFRTMADLEAWSKKHPTHLAIFGEFHKMVKKYDFQISLKLWHEVAVLDHDHGYFDYINCHNKTGLLASL